MRMIKIEIFSIKIYKLKKSKPMEKYRCFISVDFGQNVIRSVLLIQKDLNKLGFHAIRWMPEENLHLTLKFLGDVSQELIPLIIERLDRVSSEFSYFVLKISKMGEFPSWNNPRILWLGFENSSILLILAKKVEEGMREFGFPPEGRDFTPHLTIGRIKERLTSVEAGQLKQIFNQKIIKIPDDKVREINLYRSILKTTGAEYTLLHSASLKE
jgi:RNA 2',3'-cyclic 3'-phosphodiesterase